MPALTLEGVTMAADAGCPKRMEFGPCGGVRPDGQCEMRDSPCVFDDAVAWSGPQPAPRPARAPRVLTDFSCTPFDPADIAATASVLAPGCDAVLVGEHQNKPDFPPTLMASLLLDAGVTPWITLSCRDRNRVVLEQELRGLRSINVETVLCVTGDGRGYDVRPDVTQTFDLDGPRLVSLAASVGIVAAVPETPTAPPVRARPARLVEKQRAGASLAVLNHVPFPDMVADFMTTARSAGLTIPVIAAVAVFTDSVSAAVLEGLPGLELDRAVTERVLSAPDPVAAGIAAAVVEARALLSIPGVDGVNVSGLASASGPRISAEIKAEVGRRIRAEASS
jgi:5,10-methylenetetrahydrofolate reductase